MTVAELCDVFVTDIVKLMRSPGDTVEPLCCAGVTVMVRSEIVVAGVGVGVGVGVGDGVGDGVGVGVGATVGCTLSLRNK